MIELCRVFVIDDGPTVREAHRVLLARHNNYEVVSGTRNDRGVVEAYGELKPNVVLMDPQMPDTSRVNAMHEVSWKHHGACIMVLTTFDTQEYIVSVLCADTSGYLMKDCGGPALLTSIWQTRDDKMPLALGVRRELVVNLLAGHPKILTDETAVAEFAPRKRELLAWLGQGMTSAQVTAKVFISEGSVE